MAEQEAVGGTESLPRESLERELCVAGCGGEGANMQSQNGPEVMYSVLSYGNAALQLCGRCAKEGKSRVRVPR